MRDLEIRGAGNLLGAEQHGNIAGVGFATYCNMLEDTVSRLRAERENKPVPKKMPDTTVELRQDAYLDEDYISNGGAEDGNLPPSCRGGIGRGTDRSY